MRFIKTCPFHCCETARCWQCIGSSDTSMFSTVSLSDPRCSKQERCRNCDTAFCAVIVSNYLCSIAIRILWIEPSESYANCLPTVLNPTVTSLVIKVSGMGCTPSIHVNQTGVVTYCRDSDESNSPHNSHHTQLVKTDGSVEPGGSGLRKKGDYIAEDSKSAAVSIIEAETQTSRLLMKVGVT